MPDQEALRDRILEEALSLNEASRRTFVEEACRGDVALQREVERLLLLNQRMTTQFLTQPAWSAAAPDGVAHRASASPPPRIGPYRIVQVIGEGGMGTVYLAEQQTPVRRLVALKLIRPGMDSEHVIARFEAERQALAMMDHPNIARVLDAGAAAGRPYFVMELVDGVPITQHCDANQFTIGERVEVFRPVCQAVQHAHQKGVIHRDIKPSNILVATFDGRPVPKVIDFGLAKAIAEPITDRPAVTRIGAVLGTVQYMSPEQAQSAGSGLDTRSDVYSLGAVLYELLTGTTPLSRERLAGVSHSEVLRWIAEEEPPPPSARLAAAPDTLEQVAALRRTTGAKLPQQLAGDLDWVVMRAIEKDPARRYPTVNALLRDLERYVSGEPVEAGPPSKRYRLRKFSQRHRTLLIASSLSAFLLLVATAFSAWQAVRAGRERDRALAAVTESEAIRLVSYAIESLAEDPERSLILALHAVQTSIQAKQPVLPAAERMLHSAIVSSRTRLTLRGHQAGLATIAFSPNGERLVTGGEDNTARIWDAATGKAIHTLTGHSDWVWDAEFSPDGTRVVTASPDRTARIWDVATGREILTLRGHQHSVRAARFSPDGSLLATSGVDKATKVWDASNGRLLLTILNHEAVTFLKFEPGGHRIITVGSKPLATVWDARTGAQVRTIAVAGFGAGTTRFTDMTSSRVAVVSLQDRRFALRLWDFTSRREQSVIVLPERPSAARFSPDGSKVAVADSRRTRILDPASGRELALFQGGHTGPVTALVFSPDGESLATASLDKTARNWDVRSPGSNLTFRAADGPVRVAFHPNGLRLATWGVNGANLWDAGTGRLLAKLRSHEGAIVSLAVSRDGTRFATGVDRTAIIWDADSARPILTLRGHTDRVGPVRFCPDRTRLLTGSSDKTARIWDGSTGGELITMRGHTSAISSVACSPDGRLIATGSDDNTVRIWDAMTGREVVVLRGHDSALRGHGFFITRVAFSPDGAQLLTASVDGTAKLWDTASGRSVWTLTGHQDAVLSATFSPDGRRIATASFDKTVRIWDSATGEHRFTLGPYDDRLYSVTFSPDGRRLAMTDAQGYVKVHPIDIPSLLKLARRRVTRPLTSRECQTYFHKPACPELP